MIRTKVNSRLSQPRAFHGRSRCPTLTASQRHVVLVWCNRFPFADMVRKCEVTRGKSHTGGSRGSRAGTRWTERRAHASAAPAALCGSFGCQGRAALLPAKHYGIHIVTHVFSPAPMLGQSLPSPPHPHRRGGPSVCGRVCRRGAEGYRHGPPKSAAPSKLWRTASRRQIGESLQHSW